MYFLGKLIKEGKSETIYFRRCVWHLLPQEKHHPRILRNGKHQGPGSGFLKDKTPQEIETLVTDFILDIVDRTQDAADGYYLMAPLQKTDLVCRLIQRIHTVFTIV